MSLMTTDNKTPVRSRRDGIAVTSKIVPSIYGPKPNNAPADDYASLLMGSMGVGFKSVLLTPCVLVFVGI